MTLTRRELQGAPSNRGALEAWCNQRRSHGATRSARMRAGNHTGCPRVFGLHEVKGNAGMDIIVALLCGVGTAFVIALLGILIGMALHPEL